MNYRRSFIPVLIILLAGLLSSCPGPGGEGPKERGSSTKISSADRNLITEKTRQITEPVTIHFYSRGDRDKGVTDARALLTLIDKGSAMVFVEEHNILADPQEGAQTAGITRGPVMILEGKDPYGMRYDGYPARMELSPFLDSIIIASGQVPPLMDQSRALLENLKQKVVIKVFVTPD